MSRIEIRLAAISLANWFCERQDQLSRCGQHMEYTLVTPQMRPLPCGPRSTVGSEYRYDEGMELLLEDEASVP